ncbi:MAG: hypothetical protein KatS3mg108_2853 [Isosphaeraceae bacterium]|nr:MAG: hypothetical protein KatS3mg108_2853 [Isosphaeraceae bacterium]
MIEHPRRTDPSAQPSLPPGETTARRWTIGLAMVGVIVYSVSVLWFVATAGDTGLRCVFGPRVREVGVNRWSPIPVAVAPDLRGPEPPPSAVWSSQPPHAGRQGDRLTMLAGIPIENYSDFVQATRKIRDRIGEYVEVRWESPSGPRFGHVRVERPPLSSYLWSLLWFLQEMVIFGIGARVFWRRPTDASARVFFWLCVVTVVAFMGGYHWSQIATEMPLIFPFAALVVFVPPVSLHFYLIFPRIHPFFARHRRPLLALIYGLPTLTATVLWVLMSWSRWGQNQLHVEQALGLLRAVSLAYIGLSILVFLVCLAFLIDAYRLASTRAERNQVRWILLATVLSVPPIAWLVYDASIDPARWGMSRSVWPMSIVSMLYTVAYAFSITRYKLLQAEELYNRGVIYVAVSVTAGILYSAGLVLGALIVGERLLSHEATLGTVVACVTALVIMILSGAARQRFQKAIDRRFHREKYKFDQAMRRMSTAVGQLVDRPTLARGLLEAAGEVLRVDWGALYLAGADSSRLTLAAALGPEPDEVVLEPDNPLVLHFKNRSDTLRVPHAMALLSQPDPATDAMIALGGEVATPLEAHTGLAGLLILGPKRSGMPYEEEELAFLSALGSVATLALRSADIQKTLETLNHELAEKVDKIAEQQRRILILQEQLSLSRARGRPVETFTLDAPDPSSTPAQPSAAPTESQPADPEPPGADPFDALKGSSPALQRTIHLARKVAGSSAAVLIRGPSGAGKERLAEAIHAASPRASRPFVKVHCAALAPGLLESELFGHVKGAFTDARSDRVGRFQQADGGTLFLDEIGDISLDIQTKLLRVLQEMSFEKVGSSQTIRVDVRLITATHQDLEALIRAGRFREDLFYRLNVVTIVVPPLSQRREDLFELALHFLTESARRTGKAVTRFADDAIEAILAHDWPGNVRELENAIERAVVLADGPEITRDDLPAQVAAGARRGRPRRTPASARAPEPIAAAVVAQPGRSAVDALDPEWADYERHRLIDALTEARGNKSEAARLLGLPRSTFFSRLKKHGLA